MTKPQSAPYANAATIVVVSFQKYLGSQDDVPLSSVLLSDLGLDSIALLVILLEISEDLKFDIQAIQEHLIDVQTVGDVVSAVALVLDTASAAAQPPS